MALPERLKSICQPIRCSRPPKARIVSGHRDAVRTDPGANGLCSGASLRPGRKLVAVSQSLLSRHRNTVAQHPRPAVSGRARRNGSSPTRNQLSPTRPPQPRPARPPHPFPPGRNGQSGMSATPNMLSTSGDLRRREDRPGTQQMPQEIPQRKSQGIPDPDHGQPGTAWRRRAGETRRPPGKRLRLTALQLASLACPRPGRPHVTGPVKRRRARRLLPYRGA